MQSRFRRHFIQVLVLKTSQATHPPDDLYHWANGKSRPIKGSGIRLSCQPGRDRFLHRLIAK